MSPSFKAYGSLPLTNFYLVDGLEMEFTAC